jgi:hypothetical protein
LARVCAAFFPAKCQLAIIDALWVHGFFGVACDAFMMFEVFPAAFSLASLIAARLPAPLPIVTDVSISVNVPLIGGIIFCGLLINVLRLFAF